MTVGTVLIVEDNPITRKMLRLTLESEGCAVLEAGDAAGALAAVARGAPDLVLLDYVLPDGDGLALLAEMRRRCGAPQLPALLVTGLASRPGEGRGRGGARCLPRLWFPVLLPALEEPAARGGAAVYVLPKPVEPSTLVQLVRAQ